MKSIQAIIPGVLLTVVIAATSKFIESILPMPLISASVIALFIGMIINYFLQSDNPVTKGATFASKKLLKLGIILLGASLNMATVFQVGRLSLSVMVFTLLTCFGIGHFSGKFFGLNWKMSNLISAGTGICGGSAIASIAPVIEADDLDVAYAMSATFIFDMAMIILFPIMGHALGLLTWPTASGRAPRSTTPRRLWLQATPSPTAPGTSPPWSSSPAPWSSSPRSSSSL